MKRTKKSKEKNEEQPARDLAEEALDIVIQNAALDEEMIKALRLTCKRTKVASDARVREFQLCLDDQQEAEAIGRSGLLINVTKLDIAFDFMPANDVTPTNPQDLARALGLLNLAADVCSKSLKFLYVAIDASAEITHACSCFLSNSTWESLQVLTVARKHLMSGFLSGALARRASFPALKLLRCLDPSADDIEALAGSLFVRSLKSLTIRWPYADGGYESNTAPATVAAMRNLLQKATSLKYLDITSSTFYFFDCENLNSLKTLHLKVPGPPAHRARVDLSPVLAQPWKMLETLHIGRVFLNGPHMVRIFEAEDTLPALEDLNISHSTFNVDTLSCVRCRRLERFLLVDCNTGHVLLSKLAQLMKGDRHALPSLRMLIFMCFGGDLIPSVIEALSQLLSCPQMAALETLYIWNVDIGIKGSGLLCDIANRCPNLEHLSLRYNNLRRPAVALLAGYGSHMGAWPNLQKLGILDQRRQNAQDVVEDNNEDNDLNSLTAEHPYMPKLDVQTTLRRAWPGLVCY